MVHLSVTPRIRDALAALAELDDEAHPSIRTLYDGAAIDHQDLYQLSQLLSSSPSSAGVTTSDDHRYTFTTLVRGTEIYHPPPPPPPAKTPEYIALMVRLRREAEEREYHALTASSDEEEMTWAEVKSQVTTIFNVLLSTAATAGAVWKVAEGWRAPERLALAMITAIVVCVAEVVLFWGFVRRVDEGTVGKKVKKAKQRNEKETEIVESWEIGGRKKKE